jgi:predicted signal transduction protein with EAL and GGDEF domain
MMRALRALDQVLDRLSPAAILASSGSGIMIVAGIDYVTGSEVSMSLFYLGPIALATWYGGRRAGFAIAVISCLAWFLADQAAGGNYSTATIPVWNAFVRLGFFLITAHLLDALRESLASQHRLARTDGLTGLYRRGVFEERLRHDVALARRHNGMVTIAYVDVDDFKVVNDTLGTRGRGSGAASDRQCATADDPRSRHGGPDGGRRIRARPS